MLPVGFELTTSRSSVSCSATVLSCSATVLSHYLVVSVNKAFIKSCSIDSRNKQSPTCEVVHETKESSLHRSPTDSLLAQLAEHETDDLELVSSNPTGDNF